MKYSYIYKAVLALNPFTIVISVIEGMFIVIGYLDHYKHFHLSKYAMNIEYIQVKLFEVRICFMYLLLTTEYLLCD